MVFLATFLPHFYLLSAIGVETITLQLINPEDGVSRPVRVRTTKLSVDEGHDLHSVVMQALAQQSGGSGHGLYNSLEKERGQIVSGRSAETHSVDRKLAPSSDAYRLPSSNHFTNDSLQDGRSDAGYSTQADSAQGHSMQGHSMQNDSQQGQDQDHPAHVDIQGSPTNSQFSRNPSTQGQHSIRGLFASSHGKFTSNISEGEQMLTTRTPDDRQSILGRSMTTISHRSNVQNELDSEFISRVQKSFSHGVSRQSVSRVSEGIIKWKANSYGVSMLAGCFIRCL